LRSAIQSYRGRELQCKHVQYTTGKHIMGIVDSYCNYDRVLCHPWVTFAELFRVRRTDWLSQVVLATYAQLKPEWLRALFAKQKCQKAFNLYGT
jgi:hypothetical protein